MKENDRVIRPHSKQYPNHERSRPIPMRQCTQRNGCGACHDGKLYQFAAVHKNPKVILQYYSKQNKNTIVSAARP